MQKIKEKIRNLLIRSQKYTGTDMIYLAKGGFWLNTNQIIATFTGLGVAWAFANLIPKETFGTYNYIRSLADTFAFFTLGSMTIAITQAAAQNFDGSLIAAIKTRLKWGVLGTIGCFCIAGYYFWQQDIKLGIAFCIAAALMPPMNSLSSYTSFLVGKKLFDIQTKYRVIIEIINLITMGSVLYLSKNVLLILFAYYFSNTALNFIFLTLTVKNYCHNDKQNPETIPFGRNLSFTGIAGAIASNIDKILIWHFLGATEVAIYTFALTLPKYINNFIEPINTLAFPKFSEQNETTLRQAIPQKIFKYSLITIPIAIIYATTAPPIFKLFFPQYMDAVFYSQLYVFTLMLLQSFAFIVTYFNSHLKKKQSYLWHTVSPFFHIIALIILLPYLGLLGAILALMISQIFSLIFLIILFRKF